MSTTVEAPTKEFNWATMVADELVKELAVPLEDFIKEVLAREGIPTRGEFNALAKKIDDLSPRISSN